MRKAKRKARTVHARSGARQYGTGAEIARESNLRESRSHAKPRRCLAELNAAKLYDLPRSRLGVDGRTALSEMDGFGYFPVTDVVAPLQDLDLHGLRRRGV